ncbi:unnamed protein product [Prorocentrum cordatum]|uniref:Uncharacterized protein n=1 Tax=Prorocentrum cordatum TaxID=2364126 RepID=A0ABN9WSA0_9DINO|nr:unnamed protein product [Polarella glacialis]
MTSMFCGRLCVPMVSCFSHLSTVLTRRAASCARSSSSSCSSSSSSASSYFSSSHPVLSFARPPRETGGNVPAPAAPQGGRPSGAPSSWRRTPWAGGDCPDGVAVAAPSAAGLPPLMAPAPAVLRRTWTPEDLYSNSSVAKMAVDYWRTQGPRAQGGSRPSTSTTTTTGGHDDDEAFQSPNRLMGAQGRPL